MKRMSILFGLAITLILTLPLLGVRVERVIATDALAADMPSPAPGEVGVSTKPNAATLSKGAAPNPPANVDKKTAVGSGKFSVNTANPKDDGDSLWIEEIDIDSDGNVETAAFLYDDEDKVTYIYANKDFTCTDGGAGKGGIMIVVYNKGNIYKKPVGSGWYAYTLDEGECGAKEEAVWGCEFDAKGNATACGLAAIVEDKDDITIVGEEIEK